MPCRRFVPPALAVLLLAVPATIAATAGSPKASPADLAFIEGAWEGEMWGGRFRSVYAVEEWIALGHGELVKEGKEAFHVFEQFALVEGNLVFTPYPGGQPSGSFPLASLEKKARRAVFENPAKDFPTRIEFHRAAEERLVITLSDPHREGAKTEVFDLVRKK
jgi:hypothetical protein